MGRGAAVFAGQIARLGGLPDDDERGLIEIEMGSSAERMAAALSVTVRVRHVFTVTRFRRDNYWG